MYDLITHRKMYGILNKEKITPRELDQIFNSWCYEGLNDNVAL